MKTEWFCHMFTVRGTGAFPLRMLQMDRCVPATDEDTQRIAKHLGLLEELPTQDRATVIVLYRFSAVGPTDGPDIAAWKALGWPVVHVTYSDRTAVSYDGAVLHSGEMVH